MCALWKEVMFDARHPEKSTVHKIATIPIKKDSLNAVKGEVTHGDWKFRSVFVDVLI